MNEDKLRVYIRKMLAEGPDVPATDDKEKKPPSKRKKKKADTAPGEIGVTAGRGSWSKSVKEAGALAEEAPDELMSNLGIKNAASGFAGISKLLNQAFKESDVMKRSYGGISNVTQGKSKGIMISMGELDSRNGAKYLHHTLIGAQNAGKLSLDVPVQIQRIDTGTVVIHSSPMKNSWVVKDKKQE